MPQPCVKAKLNRLIHAREGLKLRDFLLMKLNQHQNVTDCAAELGVTSQRVRMDMGRCDIVEIRRYYEPRGHKGVVSLISYAEAVSAECLPVLPPH